MSKLKDTAKVLRLMDALCVWCLTAGGALVLIALAGLTPAFWAIALSAAILLAAFLLIEAKPLPSLAIITGLPLLIALGALALKRWDDLAGAIGGYARWAIAQSAYIADTGESGAVSASPQLPVYIAACAPLALIFWLIMRKLPSLWAVTAIAAGLIGCKAVFIPEDWELPFVLLWAGLILFLPRASHKGAGRLQAQVLAAVLAVPVLGLAVLICPRSDGDWRSVGVQHVVQDCQDMWEFHFGQLPELPLTSMRSMGLQPVSARLGGDISPGDQTIISGDKQVLLRGQALDVYTGSTWERSAGSSGNFRLDSLMWQLRRKEAFGLDLPKHVSKPLLNELLDDVYVELRGLRRSRSLFLPYRTSRIETAQGGNELYFDMQGDVYWSRQAMANCRYTVRAQVWNFRDSRFDRNMLMLEEAMEGEFADDALPGITDRFTQLPDTLPKWVRELAGELTSGGATPYSKAMAVRDYLSAECTYTLTPGSPDPEEDFTAAFLRDKQGYCTYYASALTVLCRAAGIPARYVTGYAMIPDGGRFIATESTAHAWTEVYIGNIGWVPMDALGMEIFQNEPLYDEAIPDGLLTGPIATPTPDPNANLGSGLDIIVPKEDGNGSALGLLWLIPLILPPVILAAYRRIKSRRYREEYVLRKYPAPEDAAGYVASGLLRLLGLIGLQPQGGETPLAFWSRAGERFPDDELGVQMPEIGKILNRLSYGGIPPELDDLHMLCKAYGRLEAYARHRLGVLGWFIV